MADLTNIAYSNEYIELKNKIINLVYNSINRTNEEETIDGNLKRIITKYETQYDGKEYFCSNNKIYDENNKFIFEYLNLYDHDFFCDRIKYNNGQEYIFYKTDLYGYNVFEMDTQKTFEYFPRCSFMEDAEETFIGTDIHFNPNNNIFAVEGCYWACPADIFLLKIDNPLKQYEKYIDIHLMIDKDHEKYDDIDFVEWENNDIKIKCYNRETKLDKNEIIILKEKEYMGKMIKI